MKFELQTIEHSNHPEILQQKAKRVTFPLTEELQEIVAVMKDKVIELGGVGLAAPQIGVPWQIITVHISEQAAQLRSDAEPTQTTEVYFNPSYKPIKDTQVEEDWEGCFSVKTLTGKVPRHYKIVFEAQDQNGQPIEKEVQGFYARVLQHETDHIHGILIKDLLTPGTLHGSPQDMSELRIQEMSPKQKQLMKTMIEEAIARGESKEEHQALLELLSTQQVVKSYAKKRP